MSLKLIGAHPHVSLQGTPAPGRRRFGVPPGGAFDQELWRITNSLSGNREPASAFEIAFQEVVATVTSACRIAIGGASFAVDGIQVLGSVVHLESGQRLEVTAPYRARAYLSVAGGIASFENGLVVSAQTLNQETTIRSIALADREPTLRVVPFCDSPSLAGWRYRVSHQLNRIGIRLEGPPRAQHGNGVSEPTCFGAIQATHDGQLIILGPDGPTIGGYPTQAVVCQADLDRLAQLRAGDEVEFIDVSLEEARRLTAARSQDIEARLSAFGRHA